MIKHIAILIKDALLKRHQLVHVQFVLHSILVDLGVDQMDYMKNIENIMKKPLIS